MALDFLLVWRFADRSLRGVYKSNKVPVQNIVLYPRMSQVIFFCVRNFENSQIDVK